MPAFNAGRTVKDTYLEIPKTFRKKVILIDDKSSDNTISVAKKLGIKTFLHPQNLGYGGSQKTGYREALKYNPDVVVMLHPDYQYDGTKIPELIEPIIKGRKDFMFGSRMQTKKEALRGGMPLLKYYINRVFCFLENKILRVNFSEHFSGLRAYSPRLLKTIPFQNFSNDFVFDQQMEISAVSLNFRIGEIPIPTRYHEKSSSIKFVKGTKFILETLFQLILFILRRK
jgi:glycosyltransferase involved in cell wall biosynthesis